MKKDIKIINSGLCCCIYEPRGDNGLEGYQRGKFYRFERCSMAGKTHFRVYPGSETLKDGTESPSQQFCIDTGYYETCGTTIFNRHFEISE